jgi:hypothetical protein
MNWLDIDLCRTVLDLIDSASSADAIDLSLVICSYLVNTQADIAEAHLAKLSLTPEQIQQHQSLVDLICLRFETRGLQCQLDSSKSETYRDSALTALELPVRWSNPEMAKESTRVYADWRAFIRDFELTLKRFGTSQIASDASLMTAYVATKRVETAKLRSAWKRSWNYLTASGNCWESLKPESEGVWRSSRWLPLFIKEKPPAPHPGPETRCRLLKLTGATDVGLEIARDHCDIVFEGAFVKTLEFRNVKWLDKRTDPGRAPGLEILMATGDSYYFNMDLTLVGQLYRAIQKSNSKTVVRLDAITQQWVSWQITTFEYLIALNFFSGRSFNDLARYPVFPWILRDYSAPELDLRIAHSYRDLSRPLGALNERCLKNLRRLAHDRRKDQGVGFHYELGHSNKSSVSSFLHRFEPFHSSTDQFDFNSIQSTHQRVISEEDDFRELIPEFFFSPEVFRDVKLPIWAKSPEEFVYIHRQALESEITSQSIHRWIDLIWGKRSRGRSAWKHDNLYSPDIVQGGDDDKGSLPRQLFKARHPQRKPITRTTFSVATIDITLSKPAHLHIQIFDSVFLRKVDPSGDPSILTVPLSHGKLGPVTVKPTGRRFPIGSFHDFGASSLVVSHDSLQIYDFDGGASALLPTPVQVLAVDHPLVACFDGISLLKIFSSEKVWFQIPYLGPPITSCVISSEFQLLVIGAGHRLLFLSIPGGSCSKSVELGEGEIVSMAITPGWGFLIVHRRDSTGRDVLATYSTNAVLIRERKVEFQIERMMAWKTFRGVDMIAAATEKGSVFVMDAFRLEGPEAPVMKAKQRVVGMKVGRGECLVVVTESRLFVVRGDVIAGELL